MHFLDPCTPSPVFIKTPLTQPCLSFEILSASLSKCQRHSPHELECNISYLTKVDELCNVIKCLGHVLQSKGSTILAIWLEWALQTSEQLHKRILNTHSHILRWQHLLPQWTPVLYLCFSLQKHVE
jgi:hypothetical protein